MPPLVHPAAAAALASPIPRLRDRDDDRCEAVAASRRRSKFILEMLFEHFIRWKTERGGRQLVSLSRAAWKINVRQSSKA